MSDFFSTEQPGGIRFSASAELSVVDTALDGIERLCASAEVNDEDRLQFSLGLSEVLTNMVEHSTPAQGRTAVKLVVDLGVEPQQLRAVLHDDAEPFPASARIGEATLPEELAESGRGLAIATMVLDGVEHRIQDGNLWTLWKQRS